jgi:hypothetical protein
MVERVSTLLHHEADDLAVPLAPLEAILHRGRRMRRRRRVAEGAAVFVTVGVVAAVLGTLLHNSATSGVQQRFASAPAGAAYSRYGAFAAGSTVFVGNHQVTFPEKVKALYYTSEGILVRMGKVAQTDSSGPSHYTLVHADGSTKVIDLKMGDRVAGTDPDSPNVAYAEPNGDRWDFVVVSLVTGDEVARTTVSGAFTWGGWEAPPVDLSGTQMWALFDAGWMEYDWSTGKTRTVPGTAGATFEAAHGRYAEEDPPEWRVRDFTTGDVLRTLRPKQPEFGGWLSPDGRFARIFDDAAAVNGVAPKTPVRFVTVDTGKTVSLPGGVAYGWTPDGHTLSVDPKNDQLTVCDPGTGACDQIHLEIGSGTLKLGGLSYES